MTYHEQRGEYEQVITNARHQLELEPWNEEIYQHLMRALAYAGQRSAALATYAECRRSLRKELAVGPSPETKALYESIRDGALGQALRRTAQVNDEITLILPLFLREGEASERVKPVFVAQEQELAQTERIPGPGIGRTRASGVRHR